MMIYQCKDMQDRVTKVLSDAFATVIKQDYKQKGKIVELVYVFQSYGLYLHEYIAKQKENNVYYLILSDMKEHFTTYKLNKQTFEETKSQIKPNNGPGELKICTDDIIHKRNWIFDSDINIWHAYVTVTEISENNTQVYSMKIGPEHELGIINASGMTKKQLDELLGRNEK